MLSLFISSTRLVAAALIACAFLIAPMAEAEHAQIETANTCDLEHFAETHGDGDSDHDEHEHHAHNCGPCLIHLLRRDTTSECIFHAGIQSIRPPISESLISLPPGSLYRPPRA